MDEPPAITTEPPAITTEPVQLFTTLNANLSRRCAAACALTARGQFDPVYCAHHRQNGNLVVGWGYIYREEAQLLSLLRAGGWTRVALNDAVERDLTTVFDRANIANEPRAQAFEELSSDDESDPGSPTALLQIEAADPDYSEL